MTSAASTQELAQLSQAPALPIWRYIGRLAPLVILWLVMAGLLAWLLYNRASLNEKADRGDIQEWIDHTQIPYKSLAELVREYAELLHDGREAAGKRAEIEEHIKAMTEPLRMYSSQLPLFPEIFRFEVDLSTVPGVAARGGEPISWVSPKPRPGGNARAQVRELPIDVPVTDPSTGAVLGTAVIRLEYRVHTYNQMQKQQDEFHYWQMLAASVLIPTSLFAGVIAIRFLRNERRRELDRWRAAVAGEHRERELLQAQVERQIVERELLEARVKQQEAEHAKEELGRTVLEHQLDVARAESRANEAERSALELKSQLYASIGIMAGSYAHNIKNLLVRPNDLLTRCIEANGVPHEQQYMLQEVKTTLGTVTERLQQILRTVRRDPANAEITRVDLTHLVRESQRTWVDMARDKWKIHVAAETGRESLWVNGDLSHLQQAVENLVFNARDATFEMRNHLRDDAKREPDPAARRQRLLDAAAWKGEVMLRVFRDGESVVLEVRDNGIGMTDEVRKNCLKTHFTTKRDNALYEGYNAGMGLGLSFVAVVLEHHAASLDIESAPLRGTTFRIRLPLPGDTVPKPTPG